MKKDTIKKVALIILIVLTFNIMVPTYSNAGVLGSLLSKPVASLVMLWLNSINLRLSLVFGTDAAVQDFMTDIKANSDVGYVEGDGTDTNPGDSDDQVIDKFLDALDTAWETLIEPLANLCISPDDIFSGKIQIADANIFSDKYDTDNDISISDINVFNHLMKSLKETIAGLYYIMRNLAVVILLCLLIYCGIRIVLASNNAGEKAKWQEYLLDWVKALAIVMFIHIIMIAIFYVVDIINEGLKNSIGTGNKIGTMIMNNFAKESFISITGVWIYVIMYAYLTYMNIVFLIAYFKRLVYIMFMIVIAPIVGALYPLGKRGHQIFSKWFNEFLSGVMIQPFHYLIYTILLAVPLKLMQSGGTTGSWGNVTPISVQLYCLISIAMIRPIEKLSRQVFQFGNTVMDNVASFESGKQPLDAAAKAAITIGAFAAGVPQAAALTRSIGNGEGDPVDMEEGYIDYFGPQPYNGQPLAPYGPQSYNGQPLGPYEPQTDDEEVYGPQQYNGEPLAPYGPQPYNGEPLAPYGPQPYNGEQLAPYGPQPYNGESLAPYEESGVPEKTGKKTETDAEENVNDSNKLESGNELKLDSANIEINTANEMSVDAINKLDANAIEGLDAGEMSEESENNLPVIENGATSEERNALDGKDVLSSSMLSKLFFTPDRGIGTGIEKLLNKAAGDPTFTQRYKQVLSAPETKEKILDVRAAMHEFVDSLYAPGQASGDWKNNVEFYNEQFIKVEKERLLNDFVNSKDNINKAIVAYQIEDKIDKKTGEVVKTKEEQAQEKLKAMEPYVYKGINDVHQIKALEDRGQNPKEAVKSAGKENITINHFMKRGDNAKQMASIVLPKIPEAQRNNPQVIKQYVKQELEMGKQYITSGYAKDPETLNRLIELEKKLDQKLEIRGEGNIRKSDNIATIDAAINKALKDGVKDIKLQNPKGTRAIGRLQVVMNDELKSRREANPPDNKKKVKQVNPPVNN